MSAREQLIRRMYEKWGEGDLEGWLSACAPDIDFTTSGSFPGLAASYSGHAGMRQFWQDFGLLWERIEIVPERIVEEGDHAVALWNFTATGRGGVPVVRRGAHLVTFGDDGVVVRLRSFGDWESPLRVLEELRGQVSSSAG